MSPMGRESASRKGDWLFAGGQFDGLAWGSILGCLEISGVLPCDSMIYPVALAHTSGPLCSRDLLGLSRFIRTILPKVVIQGCILMPLTPDFYFYGGNLVFVEVSC